MGLYNAIREESEEGCDLELQGCVQGDGRARSEQRGINWQFSMLSEWCNSSRKLVMLFHNPD